MANRMQIIGDLKGYPLRPAATGHIRDKKTYIHDTIPYGT